VKISSFRNFSFQLFHHQPSTIHHQPLQKVDADEDGNGGDDAADALRYLVATKARTIVQRKLRGL
jgi:hypothetical protein